MYVRVTFRSYAKGDDEDVVSPSLSVSPSSSSSFSLSMFDANQTFVLNVCIAE
jgi:hypothetical protein